MSSYTHVFWLSCSLTCLYFLAPEALFIIQETRNLGAKQPVNFELVQLAVSNKWFYLIYFVYLAT